MMERFEGGWRVGKEALRITAFGRLGMGEKLCCGRING